MTRFAFAIGVEQQNVQKYDLDWEHKALRKLKSAGHTAKPDNVFAYIINTWWYEEGRLTDRDYISNKVKTISKIFPREQISRFSLCVQGLLGDNHPLYKLAGEQLHIIPLAMGKDSETHVSLSIHEVKETFPRIIREFQRLAEQLTLMAHAKSIAQEGRDLQVSKHNQAAAEAKWDKVIQLINRMPNLVAPRYLEE
jgi:hypothetical protein